MKDFMLHPSRSPDVLKGKKRPVIFHFAMFCLALSSGHAASIITKINNTNALNTGASWTGGIVPGSSTVATWNADVTSANSTSLGADLQWLGIQVTSAGGAVTINNNTLTLGQYGINVGASQSLVINSNVTMQAGARQRWITGTGGSLQVNGAINRLAGSTLNIQGDVTTNTVTPNITNDSTGILGAWASQGSGLNTTYATVDATTKKIVAYTAGTTVTNATGVTDVTGGVNYNVGAVGALGTGASFNTLRYTGAAGDITGNFNANGLMGATTANDVNIAFTGNIEIGASRELVVHTSNGNITLSGVISDSVSGASALVKTGGGASRTLTLSGANTYTGVTYINDGVVTVTNAQGLGSTVGHTVIYTGDTAAPAFSGGQLRVQGGINVAERLSIYGASNNQDPFSLSSSTGTNTLSGAITLMNNDGVRVKVFNGELAITGGITMDTGFNGFLILNPDTATSVLSFSNTAVNLGASGRFYLDNEGTVLLNTTGNTWATTTIARGTMKMGQTNALPTGTNVAIGLNYGGDSTTTEKGGTFDLNGFSQVINNLSVGSTSTDRARIVTSATAATLTLTNGSGVFAGQFTQAVGLIKNGTGTFTLGLANTHTGDTRVNAGTLAVENIDALQNSTLDTGASSTQQVTFTVSGNNTYNVGGLKGSDALDIKGNTIRVGSNNQSTQFDAAISNSTGSGSLIKVGTGSLRLSTASTYAGGTNVSGGSLYANNTAGSATGTGSVTVQTGGTFGGIGIVSTTAGFTVQSGGTLAPGNGAGSPDKLSIISNVTLQSGAFFNAQIAIGGVAGEGNGTNGTSLLELTGTLNLTGSSLTGTWGGGTSNVFAGGTLSNDAKFWLVNNDGVDTITGQFSNANVLWTDASVLAMFDSLSPSAYSAYRTNIGGREFALFYDANFTTGNFYGGNDLLLIAVPEPGRGILLFIAASFLFLRRRR